MNDLSRRSFIGFGTAAAVALPGIALAEGEGKEQATLDSLVGNVDVDYSTNPGTEQTLSVEEINAVRHAIVDRIVEDHVQDDGTVIPAVYVKVRELINTFSHGIGYGVKDGNWDEVMHYFSEDEAQAILEMPWGVLFTAQDFAAESGREEGECEEICYELSLRGALYRMNRGNINYYHLNGYFHGLWEFGSLYHVYHRTSCEPLPIDHAPTREEFVEHFTDPAVVELCDMHTSQWGEMSTTVTATPFFYTHPVGQEVIKDGEKILPYDDWRAQVARHTIIAVSPCQCRMRRYAQDAWIYDGPCDHPIETCMSFGEFAEYYIENGIGRQISQEEATAIIEDAIDHGMVLESMYTKAQELFCFCHGDCCDILSGYVAKGDDIAFGAAGVKQMNVSHYLLDYDKDKCLKCGACVDRCPLFAIYMGEDGYPEVKPTCVRCGQCGLVCPADARKLTAREDVPYLPSSLLDDYNLKASDRISHGVLE